jgi:integrase
MGTTSIPKAVQEYFDKANAKLKGSGVTLEIRTNNNILNIRGTLPPKPGSGKLDPYQQRICLHNANGMTVKANSIAAIQWAEQHAKRVSSDLNLGKFDWAHWIPKEELNIKESLLHLWDLYTEHKATYLSPTSIQHDFKMIRGHLVRMQAAGLSIESGGYPIRDYLIANRSAATSRRVLTLVSACFRWAIERHLRTQNPYEGLASTVKVTKQDTIDPFNAEEVRLILEGFDRLFPHYTPYVKFLFSTGCRTAEASGIAWGHIDLRQKVIVFQQSWTGKIDKGTKTGKSRQFPCPDSLVELLKSIRPPGVQPADIVFLAPKGGRIDNHNFINKVWRRVLEAQKVRYRRQYQTRHTFASRALAQGIPIPKIAKWLGHDSTVLLRHYGGVVEDYKVPELF